MLKIPPPPYFGRYLHAAVTYFGMHSEHDEVSGVMVDRTLESIHIDGHQFRFVDMDGDGEMSFGEAELQVSSCQRCVSYQIRYNSQNYCCVSYLAAGLANVQ